MTFGMWKCEYVIFNLPRDHKKNWAEAKFGSYRYGEIGDFNLFHDLT